MSPFRRMKLLFDSLPHFFSITKNLVILIIAGNGVHFICYLAVNFGAHFQEGNAADMESTFIANSDSGSGNDNTNPFVQWLLAVIYELEVWVIQFFNTPAMGLIESPSPAKIGRKCKIQIQRKAQTVCSIPIPRVNTSTNLRRYLKLWHLCFAQYKSRLFWTICLTT
jgi:hypothetical protein